MKALKKHSLFRGEKIFFTDSGKGRAIVLLHGFLGSSEIWHETQQSLSKHFRVIAIDLPGHGYSACFGYIHSMNLLAQAVKSVMDQLYLKRYVVVGHSMGGYAALAFAELFPENVSGICLFHSTAFCDEDRKKADRKRAVRLVKSDAKVYTKGTIKNLFSSHHLKQNKPQISFAQKIALKTSKRGIINALEGMRERPNRDVILHFADYPIMFIIGKYDAVLPMQTLLNQSQICKKKYALLLEKSGHMGFLEETKLCIKHLKRFFRISFSPGNKQLSLLNKVSYK
jgi:pimeloyl-ACP methyl ester carboxylesterase